LSRLSQAIAEGDGISVLVEVYDMTAAGSAEGQGADGLVVRSGVGTVQTWSQLPLLFLGAANEARAAAADAVVVPAEITAWETASELGLECVVRVEDADDLERALEELERGRARAAPRAPA
jgi:hypothetical protein